MKLVFYLKHQIWVVLFAIIFQNPTSAQWTAYETKFPSMGTQVEIMVYSDNAESVRLGFQDAQQLTEQLAAILTDYEPTSETRTITQRAFNHPVHVSDPLWDVLARASYWNERSSGAFDCSIGNLTYLWRKYRRAQRIPERELVDQARTQSGWQHLRLDLDRRTVTTDHPQLRLDFGAIGKGYVVDRIYDLLQQRGLTRCLVNISGNMRAGDPPPDRSNWRIAISAIEENGPPLRKIGLKHAAIATSGDLWQFTVVDGIRRSHILDPKTGYGVPGPLVVTIIAPTAIDADALATIGCIQEWNALTKLLVSEGNYQALRASQVDGKLDIVQSADFPPDLSE